MENNVDNNGNEEQLNAQADELIKQQGKAQSIEQQVKISKEMFNYQQKKLKENRRRYKRLKRNKIWAWLCCICLILFVMWMSILVFGKLEPQYYSRMREMKQEYAAEYQQWKASKFKNYYAGCLENRQMPGTILNDSNRNVMNTYIASLDRVKKGLNIEEFAPISLFTYTDTFDMNGYTIAGSGNTVIFPGAMLKGDTLFQGTSDYTLLSLERTPMYFTSNQAGGYSERIENVNYRTVSEFLEKCAEKNEGNKAKEWSYYMQVCKSSNELKATLGVEIPNIGGFEFGSTSSTEYSSVAVVYTQTHYTVSVEPKASAVEYFQNGVDLVALGDYEPAYISSVDYGRMIVVLVHGNMSSKELAAKVGACIKGVSITAGLSNIRKDTKLTSELFQYGGEQKDAGIIMDTSQETIGIKEWWNNIWNGSKNQDTMETRINDFINTDAPATNSVPIRYTLKYVADNSFVPPMMVLSQQTMLAERDMVKRVNIKTEADIIWEFSGITVIPASDTAITSNSAEFLWDSDDQRELRGHITAIPASDNIAITSGWYSYDQRALQGYGSYGEMQLKVIDCLPYGKKNVEIGRIERTYYTISGFGLHSNIKHRKDVVPVTADVTISDY